MAYKPTFAMTPGPMLDPDAIDRVVTALRQVAVDRISGMTANQRRVWESYLDYDHSPDDHQSNEWVDYREPDPILVSRRCIIDGRSAVFDGYHITVNGHGVQDPSLVTLATPEGVAPMGFDWTAKPDAVSAASAAVIGGKCPEPSLKAAMIKTNISSAFGGIVGPVGVVIGVTGNPGVAKLFVHQALIGTTGRKLLITKTMKVDEVMARHASGHRPYHGFDLVLGFDIPSTEMCRFIVDNDIRNIGVDLALNDVQIDHFKREFGNALPRSVFFCMSENARRSVHLLDVVYSCCHEDSIRGQRGLWTLMKNRYGHAGTHGEIDLSPEPGVP